MGTLILILLTASIIFSFIAIISFLLTSPAQKNGSKKSRKGKTSRNNKNRKNKNNGGEGDRDVRITKNGKCVYPPEAKRLGIEKVVYIDVHVGDDGKIIEFQIGHKAQHGFEEAACKYIKQWSFKPAIEDGQPVDSWVRVPIKFALKKVVREI